MEFYIKVGKSFASSYPNHCLAWLFNYLSLSRISSLAWYLILILFHMLLYFKDDLGFTYKLPPGNNSKYLLSLDNWHSIIWYILVIFTLAIAFNCLISSQKCICSNSRCLPWLLLFNLILLNLFCVISM
jgi:hypothetical protein